MRDVKITKQTLQEILDMNLLDQYINQMYDVIKIPITITDTDGNILVRSTWSSFCKDYIRKDKQLQEKCIESCIAVQNRDTVLYTCPYGLEMYKVPIKVKNEVIAHLFISQFLTEEPKAEDFLNQALAYEVDPVKFLDAVSQIPVVSKEKLEAITRFVDGFIIFLHDMIDRKMRANELEETILQSYEELEATYQDISQLNDLLNMANNNLIIKAEELSAREIRYRTLFVTMQQGILLLEKTKNPNKKTGNQFLIIDINPIACQIIGINHDFSDKSQKIMMEHNLIKYILSQIGDGDEIKDFYYEPGTGKYYDIQSRQLSDIEVMICITDKTSYYEQYEKQRRQTWELVVAMGNMIEKRDLYTADHQRKVAVLATAIAIKMNLSIERVETIFIAGMLHDIGKISIPSEILTKPDRLMDIEYELMKTHVQGTYDILKSISFSLPIKEIAYQHHERLDGSGYPRSLKGEEIIYEAKILAVADVYEAITSHRPYRPSLGIEYALMHLKENSGILYDSKAVEVCIEVATTNEWNISKIEKYLKYE